MWVTNLTKLIILQFVTSRWIRGFTKTWSWL